MAQIKIRNFYFQRFFEKLKKIKSFISKIFYNSPIYGKLNFDEKINKKDLELTGDYKKNTINI